MRKTWIGPTVVFLAVMLSFAGSPPGDIPTQPGPTLVAVDTVDCLFCREGEASNHTWDCHTDEWCEDPENRGECRKYGGQECNVWLQGDCPDSGDCDEFQELTPEETEILLALEERDPLAIAGILELYPSTLELNVDRSAIQVIGCRGTVVGHFPMPGATVQEVLKEVR